MATYTFDKIEYGGNTYVVSDSGALQLTGGQVTGPVTFGDSVSIDEATLGDLVVNGSASFTNNIQVNTINGVPVNFLEKEYYDSDSSDERGHGFIQWTSVPYSACLDIHVNASDGTRGGWISVNQGTWLGYSDAYLSITSSGIDFHTSNGTMYVPSGSGTLTFGYGTSGYLAKWNGTNSLVSGPQLGSSTTTFLRNDGSWATPVGTTYSVVSKTANGLAPQLPNETTTTKFLRQDGSWAVPDYIANTDVKLQVAEVTSGTQYYPIVGTGTTAATRQYDTSNFKYKSTKGTTSSIGSAVLTLGNSTASGTINNEQGKLVLYGTNSKFATIALAAPETNIDLALPTKQGTLAIGAMSTDVCTSSIDYDSSGFLELKSISSNTAADENVVTIDPSAFIINIYDNTRYDYISYSFNNYGFSVGQPYDEHSLFTISTYNNSIYIDTDSFKYNQVSGTANGSNGYARLALGNNLASSTAGWTKGELRLYGTTQYYTSIVSGAPTANRTITLPDTTGTLAVTTSTTTTLSTTWSSNQQTKSVTGITSSNTVIVTPAPASYDAYCASGIYCSAQGSGTLTFTCEEVPTTSLTVNILIIN